MEWYIVLLEVHNPLKYRGIFCGNDESIIILLIYTLMAGIMQT
jgi:hypothetical protein